MTMASALVSRRTTSLPAWVCRPRSREPCPATAFLWVAPCRQSRAVVDSCARRLPRRLPPRSRGPRWEISARVGSLVASARTRKLAGPTDPMACATDVRTELSTLGFQRRYPKSEWRLVGFHPEDDVSGVCVLFTPMPHGARRTAAMLWQTTLKGPVKTTTDNDTMRGPPSGTDICSLH